MKGDGRGNISQGLTRFRCNILEQWLAKFQNFSSQRRGEFYAWHNQCYAHVSGRAADVCVLDRRDRSQARCSPSVCHRRRRRAPSVGCAPCATALARPLLFTGFACHVRVLDSVTRTCTLHAVRGSLFLFVLAVAECFRFAPACSCFSPAFPSCWQSAPPAQEMLAMVKAAALGQTLLQQMFKPLQLVLPFR